MKIGFFGGSFDPIHYGHLILADQLLNEAGLDKVVLVPNYISPNSAHSMKASAEDRLNLIKLAIADSHKLDVSDIEIKQEKISYFDEDMKAFHEMYPDDELYILTGQDAFMRIEKWHGHEDLLKNEKFLIGKRPGVSDKEMFGLFKELFAKYQGINIQFFDIPEMELSSYVIQNKIRVGKSIKYLMSDSCISYIDTHNLYDGLVPKLKAFVKENVKPHRYEHTCGVVETARKLAIRYEVDVNKAEIAAWFHDAFRDVGNLEHGPVAAEKIQELFGVTDTEIIEAIRNHTTGHPNMSKLDKVIYIADSLEPGRDYPYVDELRKIMYVDLDECLYELMVHTRDYVLSIGSKFADISNQAIEELKEKLGK